MGKIGGPPGKSWGRAREALGGTLVQPFAAPRSLLHRLDGYPVPAQRHHRSGATPSPFQGNWAPSGACRAGKKRAVARVALDS